MKLREGTVFIHICLFTRGVGLCPGGGEGGGSLSNGSHCIRRYASYWNTFLFLFLTLAEAYGRHSINSLVDTKPLCRLSM